MPSKRNTTELPENVNSVAEWAATMQLFQADTDLAQRRLPARHLITYDGKPVPFHQAQHWTYDAWTRFVIMAAGSQGGKTSFAPLWLVKEIYGEGVFGDYPANEVTPGGRGRGDYLAVAPTYDLFKLKMLPSILAIFEDQLGVGRFWSGDSILELKNPETGTFLGRRSTDPKMWGRIILRSANAEGGLESSTAKAAWLDEAGQPDFGVSAYRAVMRRLAINQGRLLITTTLYDFGWVEQEFIDPNQDLENETIQREVILVGLGEATRTVNPAENVTLVQFDSVVNPEYKQEEFERAKSKLPEDEFNRQYRGKKVTSRTLIYDTFSTPFNVCPAFTIPATWKRYAGIDFGGVHMAAVFFAEEPQTKMLYAYREYLKGGLTIKEHVTDLLTDERGIPYAVGGAKSEGQWRAEFSVAGLPIYVPAVADVDVGIRRVYAQVKLRQVVFFETLGGTLGQFRSYRFKRDKAGNITSDIEDKATYHYLDSIRYIISSIRDDTVWTRGMRG